MKTTTSPFSPITSIKVRNWKKQLLGPILTVTTVWNTGETGDTYTTVWIMCQRLDFAELKTVDESKNVSGK